MEEQPHTEGNPRADLYAGRRESVWQAITQLSQSEESGGDLSLQRFVQEIESDPAVAGADSPCQNLLGG